MAPLADSYFKIYINGVYPPFYCSLNSVFGWWNWQSFWLAPNRLVFSGKFWIREKIAVGFNLVRKNL